MCHLAVSWSWASYYVPHLKEDVLGYLLLQSGLWPMIEDIYGFHMAPIVHVVLHRPSAYQSNSPSRMRAGGLVLTDYRPYAFLRALFIAKMPPVQWGLELATQPQL